MKQIQVIFSKQAEQIFSEMQKSNAKVDRSLIHAIENKIQLIKANPHYGNPIKKKLIPKEYKNLYEISNLFRIELPSFWRMLYTLTDGETKIEIIAFVIEILNHKDYNKRFGYKG